MTFDGSAARADVTFHANTGQAKTDMVALREVYKQTTGAMSTEALRAAVAQEKLDRAIARHGPQSQAAAIATVAYRKELAALAVEQDVVAVSTRRSAGGLGAFSKAASLASTALIGGYGLYFAINRVLEVSKEHETSLANTRNALRDTGLSWESYGHQIEHTAAAIEKRTLFDQGKLLAGFSSLVRGNGDVAKSWEIVAAAADFARAHGLGFEASLSVLTSAANGQTRGLAKYGLVIPKVTAAQDELRNSVVHATHWQLEQAKAADKAATNEAVLAAVHRYTAGAAERYGKTSAAAQDRFNIALRHTAILIGQAIRPELAKLLNDGAHYLTQLNKTGQLQRDVTSIMGDAKQVIHGVRNAIRLLRPAIHLVVGALGGLDNAVELALILGVVRKARRAAISFGWITTASGRAARAVVADAAAEDAALNSVTASAGRAAGALGAEAAAASRLGFFGSLAGRAAPLAAVGYAAYAWGGLPQPGGAHNKPSTINDAQRKRLRALLHDTSPFPNQTARDVVEIQKEEALWAAGKISDSELQRWMREARRGKAMGADIRAEGAPASSHHASSHNKQAGTHAPSVPPYDPSATGPLTAAERAARAKAGASAEKSAHAALIKRYSSPPLELQLREARILTMQAGAARDAKELALLKLELKVQKERVALIKKRKEGKDVELAALKEEDAIQAKIDHLNAKRATKGSQEQAFLEQLSGFRNEGSDIFHHGKHGKLAAGARHVHNHKTVTVVQHIHNPHRTAYQMLREARRASEAVLG